MYTHHLLTPSISPTQRQFAEVLLLHQAYHICISCFQCKYSSFIRGFFYSQFYVAEACGQYVWCIIMISISDKHVSITLWKVHITLHDLNTKGVFKYVHHKHDMILIQTVFSSITSNCDIHYLLQFMGHIRMGNFSNIV